MSLRLLCVSEANASKTHYNLKDMYFIIIFMLFLNNVISKGLTVLFASRRHTSM